jgi:DnaJ-class molecular chaperone
MAKKDYYELLGVSRSAGEPEIKRAYRRQAKKYHPDRNPDDPAAEARFKEVQEAYHVLSDKNKRAAYDRYGHAGVDPQAAGADDFAGPGWPGAGNFREFKFGGNVDDLRDIFDNLGGGPFDDLFGRFARKTRPSGRTAHRHAPVRGQDLEHKINMSFEQAIEGATFEIDLRVATETGTKTQTISAKTPPGVGHGQRIRLRGKGQPGLNGGPPGDLYLVCNVRPHRYFKRDGDDIYIEVPISIAEAALGAKIEVPSLKGRTTVTIPPGTASGAKLRLKGRGVHNPRKRTSGNQYVVIKIVPPKNLEPHQQQVLRELLDDNPRKNLHW